MLAALLILATAESLLVLLLRRAGELAAWDAVAQLPHGNEAGGLSGAPLTTQAQAVTAQLAAKLAGAVPVIGVGGIMNGDDAAQRISAGAALVQLYTGLVFAGPALVGDCVNAIRKARS